jgi:hypothetical protein
MDSNFRFRASSDYAGVGVLGSTWAVLTLRRRDPDWNATKRRRDSERRETDPARMSSASGTRPAQGSARALPRPEKMIFWPGSPRVGNLENNDPSLIAPIAAVG